MRCEAGREHYLHRSCRRCEGKTARTLPARSSARAVATPAAEEGGERRFSRARVLIRVELEVLSSVSFQFSPHGGGGPVAVREELQEAR